MIDGAKPSVAGTTRLVAIDIGGTHARFALAEVAAGRVVSLGSEVTLRTVEHASFGSAWAAFAARAGRPLPRDAAISVACPVKGEVLKLTNSPWTIRPALLPETLGIDRFSLVNDFAAVAHALAQVDDGHLAHLCGPAEPLPRSGVVSIVGPGTGLGIGALLRTGGGYHVLPTEGGHIDFAPLDAVDDMILKRLRERHPRVSVERVVSGPGLANIYAALAAIENRDVAVPDDRALWKAALEGSDSLAAAALDRFCLTLGAVAGDIALAHGAAGVVIAGGLGLRMADHLPRSGFRRRFTAKGRYEGLMNTLPVKLITHPQPGLLGAAIAFSQEHAE